MGYDKIKKLAKTRDLTVEQLLVSVIEKHGSILKAAQHLDLSPNTLKYHLKKHGLKVITVTKVVKE